MASAVYEIQQGTVGTQVNFTITDANGDVVDVTTVVVNFIMRAQTKDDEDPADIFEACSTSGDDPAQGECHYTWADGDTDEIGKHDAWVRIVDGSTEYGLDTPIVFSIVPCPSS